MPGVLLTDFLLLLPERLFATSHLRLTCISPRNKSWRGGRRIMKVARKKRGSPSDTALYKTSQQTKSTPKRRMDRANSTKNEDICGMGSRLSKRKRTNLFDSLDPRVMEATTKARYVLVMIFSCFPYLMMASCPVRAQAWTEPPQLASKAYKERVSYEKRYYGASPKSGLIGHDGNLHYCSICLGVLHSESHLSREPRD